jgi:hypothetical protein
MLDSESLIGGYILEEFLGRGSFGKVYRGSHQLTKEVCQLDNFKLC